MKKLRGISAVLLALLLCLVLFFSCQSGGLAPGTSSGQPAQSATVLGPLPASSVAEEGAQPADRYTDIFNTAGDEGLFTARFLSMKVNSGEKTGDCMVLTSPEGKTMLIDAGIAESAPQVIDALKAMGLERLDYVMVSHPHIDHIGGMPAIFDAFDVGEILSSALVHGTQTYANYLAAVEQYGISVTLLAEGDSFLFGESVQMSIYNPEADIEYYEGFPDKSTAFINDRSLVAKFVYGDISMLFTGDIYRTRESELVEKYGDALKADLLKVPHHGDNTSSSVGFIEAVSPGIVVITYNSLANAAVPKSYRKRGAEVYATFAHGCIKACTDGKTLTMDSQFPWFEF